MKIWNFQQMQLAHTCLLRHRFHSGRILFFLIFCLNTTKFSSSLKSLLWFYLPTRLLAFSPGLVACTHVCRRTLKKRTCPGLEDYFDSLTKAICYPINTRISGHMVRSLFSWNYLPLWWNCDQRWFESGFEWNHLAIYFQFVFTARKLTD